MLRAVADLPAVPPASVDVGFAFGGVHPGKLHAHGRVVDAHKVYYSIGMVGRYELHVGLRGQSIPLPGSPFQLQVRPGPASAGSSTGRQRGSRRCRQWRGRPNQRGR